MQEPDKPTDPNDQPVVAGSDDIAQLLAEAERLTKELADSAGAKRDVDVGTEAGSREVPGEERVLVAAEDVETRLSELGSVLGLDGGEGKQVGGAAGLEAPVVEPSPEKRPKAGEAVAASRHGLSEAVRDTGEWKGVADSDAEAAQGVAAIPPGAVESSADGQVSGRGAILNRVVAMGGFCCGCLPLAAKAMPKICSWVLTQMNRPFVGLSPTTKRYIGLIAIATLLVGITSFFLPSFFQGNPYLKAVPE